MKTLRLLPIAVTAVLIWSFVAAQEPTATGPAAAGGKSAAPPKVTETHRQAFKELDEARDRLAKLSSISASMVETIALETRSVRATGRYVQGSRSASGEGWQLRSELRVRIGTTEGERLDVCDGDILTTRMQIRHIAPRTPAKRGSAAVDPRSEAKGEPRSEPEVQIARRNVTQILEAARKRKDVPMDLVVADLGMGGLPALLASIQKTMTFDKVASETLAGRPVVVLEGAWNEGQLSRWTNNQPVDLTKFTFPSYMPERVQLFIDREWGFPHRIVYLKKLPDRNVNVPLLTLEFTDVRINQPIDKGDFVFVAPDESRVMDMTPMYLQQLAPAPAPGAAGTPGAPKAASTGTAR